jgi:subtilisin family serine protease
MSRRLFLCLAVSALLCGGSLAQSSGEPDFSKLRRQLDLRQEKTRTRSLPAPRPTPAPNRAPEYNWVQPKEEPERKEPEHKEPETKRPGDSGSIGGELRTRGLASAGKASMGFHGAPDLHWRSWPFSRSVAPKPQPWTTVTQNVISQKPVAGPKQPIPLTRRNSYVILLKPDLLNKPDGGAGDLVSLLGKYGLKISPNPKTGALVSPSGRVIVEFEDTQLAATRGLKAPDRESAAPAPPGSLKEQLAPSIILKLRNEPIIDDAYVNSTVKANTLPHAVQTSVQYNGSLYRWIWSDPLSPDPAFQDGNWGLKAIRMPAVWTIMKRLHEANPSAPRPKIAVVDQGFSRHKNITFSIVDSSALSASTEPSCEAGHGNHVAGIIAAASQNDSGIDGIIPDASDGLIDAVPFHNELLLDTAGSAPQEWYARWAQYADVLNDLEDYIFSSASGTHPLHVVNLSLAYNLYNILSSEPEAEPGLEAHVLAQAKDAQRTARRFKDKILFVAAAGNDSLNRDTPLQTKWASPWAWAGTQDFATSAKSENVLIVEAVGRDGKRAGFSNIGGQVSAPGVDILSTLGPGDNVFGVCSGTSQAAPHVAALATLLFELDPAKKPSEIAGILRQTASPSPAGNAGAPEIDALEAVLKVYPAGLTLLADLNKDGKVDEDDLAIFQGQFHEIIANRANGTPFVHDLNGDGVIDNNECHWPAADMNGSGLVSLAPSDKRSVMGVLRSDLDVMELAWTKGKDDFQRALKASGLQGELAQATSTAVSPSACR